MNFASWKDRKSVAGALRTVYKAQNAEAALEALEAFETGEWDEKYSAIAAAWRRNWDVITPFFVFPEAVRKIM